MAIARSIEGYEIRLTDERWLHISIGHPEVADLYYEILQTITEPNAVYAGSQAELIAVRKINELEKTESNQTIFLIREPLYYYPLSLAMVLLLLLSLYQLLSRRFASGS